MVHSLVLLLALLIGMVAGLRAFTAPAAVAWAAALHWLNFDDTWASWLGQAITVALLTVLAAVELISDLLARIPDRTTTTLYATRLATGAFAGAALGTAWGYPWSGLGAGLLGAALATTVSHSVRCRLVAHRREFVVAAVEGLVAIGAGLGIAALTAVL